MAAKTFEEFWKIIDVPLSRQGNDYVFVKEITKIAWVAATEAAEEKFTAERTLVGVAPTTAAAAPCHRCKDYELILDVNFCPFCGFEFVRE